MNDQRLELARTIATALAVIPGIQAIALGGSSINDGDDALSDLDIECYVDHEPDPTVRAAIILPRARTAEIANRFFGPGDEWIEAESGVAIDAMFWQRDWIADHLDRALMRHEASLGYSTCFWYTTLHARPLYDPSGWLASIQARARQPYPEPLRQAIVAHNYPVLRPNQSSYLHQIAIAIERADLISVNHRVAAFFASYFDILLAVNRQPHPGEKRLIPYTLRTCPTLPVGFPEEVAVVLRSASDPVANDLLAHCHGLMDRLEAWLRAEGLG